MKQPIWNFEQAPSNEPLDETSINLRAYFDRMPDEKMKQYDPSWTDEKVMEWDDNFRDDGFLMLVCCEREVDVNEYRTVLEECIRFKQSEVRSPESVIETTQLFFRGNKKGKNGQE